MSSTSVSRSIGFTRGLQHDVRVRHDAERRVAQGDAQQVRRHLFRHAVHHHLLRRDPPNLILREIVASEVLLQDRQVDACSLT